MLKILIIILILLYLIQYLTTYRVLEQMADSENAAGDCQRSIKDFNAAIEAQKKEDQDNYNSALGDWNSKKAAFQSTFASDPAKWRKYCSDGSCDLDSFYTKYPSSAIHGFDLQNSIRTDVSGCLQACLNRDDCQWCMIRNGECWLKGATNDSNFQSWLRTKTGWRFVDNMRIDIPDGQGWGGLPPAQAPGGSATAAADWRNSGGWPTDVAMIRKSDSYFWLKDGLKERNKWDGDMYIKNTQSAYVFPDNSPVIITNVGAMPSKQHTPVELSVVCQDCRQALGQSQVTDSTQVNMSQFNQCVANLQNKTQSSSQTPSPTTAPTTLTPESTTAPTTVTTIIPITPPTTPETIRSTSETSPTTNRTYYWIGGGISLVLLIAIIIIIIIISTKKKD